MRLCSEKMTSNPVKSLLLGAGITIAIQSSSAMTVMLVGLVNSGIMQLGQTIGVIMGSNIGTTLTAWILSLSGIESGNVFIKMLKPESFSPVVAFIGIMFIMAAKSTKKKDIGKILVGFSVLMYGMELMGDAVAPLADMPQFSSILTAFTNPILGVLVGTVFTGVIQSSAASVGILQALSLTGGITFGMAIPIIMGQNIGTCVTALLSSIGVNKNARRVSVVHISFNLIGTVLFLILFYGIGIFVNFGFLEDAISPFGIALVHSIFNVCTTFMLLPFTKQLEKIAYFVIKEDGKKEENALLDERLLSTPSIAIARCRELTAEMAEKVSESFLNAIKLIDEYDEKTAKEIENIEDMSDEYEDKLGSYLVKLSRKSLSVKEGHDISILLHTIGDYERIGDHALDLLRATQEIKDKKIVFSEEAQKELKIMSSAIKEILDITNTAFKYDDINLAKKTEPLEQVLDRLQEKSKLNHIKRLQSDACTIEMGFVFNDILANFERVADHCSNVAVCLIEVAEDSFDTHKYLSQVKENGDSEFDDMYNKYKEKYTI